MSNKSIGIVLTIIIAATIFASYFFIDDLQQKKSDPGDFMPTESMIILKVNNPAKLFEEITEDNLIWKSIDSTCTIYQLLSNYSQFDSTLKLQPVLHEQMLDQPFYIALVADSSNHFQTLFIQEMKNKITLDQIHAFISKHFKNALLERPKDDILLIETKKGNSIYIRINKKVLTASANIDLLEEKQFTELKSDQSVDKERLNSFIKESVNKTDARTLINYKAFLRMPGITSEENGHALLQLLGSFANWTESDIKIKKDEILFSGFSSVDSGNFLARFRGQIPLPNKVTNIIPFNTAFFINQCFSDFRAYAYQNTPPAYEALISHIGNEVAFVNNASTESDLKDANYAVVHLSNGSESQKAFESYSKSTNSQIKEEYGSFVIRKINDQKLLKHLFGDIFQGITGNWFTFIEDYIVFSNSKESLINFIRLYDTGKTLDLNENFTIFSDNISTKSNVLIYCQPESIIPYSNNFVNNAIAEKIKGQKENINDVQGIALQFSAGENLFYSSFYLKHNRSIKEENLALWKVQLDDEVVGKPTLVWDHNSNNYNIVAFDRLSNMYLISAHGQIQWKKRIDSQPLSDIFEVDFFKNGKIQYLFNTNDFIYVIDKTGVFVESYPIKISPSATNGLSLFDYKNNKDYRLLIAQADKKVYNYNIKGNQVKGWNKPKLKDIITEEITRIVAGNKDYFIITDISNYVSIVNRRGNERIKLKEFFKKARHSSYYENKTNSKGIIITTDEEGKLVYISAAGALQFTEFEKFSSQHYFIYNDFKGDGVNEFIFLDGRELKVYNRFKKILFSYEFNSQVNEEPVIFSLGRRTKALGVVSTGERTIYLFDQNGNTIINKGIVGQTPFTVGSVNNDDELNLITASGNVLFNYRIK